MNALDNHLPLALEAAVGRVKAAVVAVAERVGMSLAGQVQNVHGVRERDLVLGAQIDLRRKLNSFHGSFSDTLRERIQRELDPRGAARRRSAAADWQSLTLVEDAEVEERMFSDRLGQQITHACEWELRELAAYMAAVTGVGRAEEDRNPLRGETLGTAVYHAIEAITADHDARKLLAKEFGTAMARAMPDCYREIIADLQARRIQPVSLSLKHVEGPGNQIGGHSGYESIRGDLPPSRQDSGGYSVHASVHGEGMTSRHGTTHGTTQGSLSGHTQRGRVGSTTSHAGLGSHRGGLGGQLSPEADLQLMSLLRRLTHLASRPGALEAAVGEAFSASTHRPPLQGSPHADPLAAEANLVAVNLIRAHREELLQASTGKLDHMVIDVVGSLFDQILSDTRVPPQMARQIARLQLPVLRVALADPNFFSSRRHPVRRFVNRIASLALAFEDFEDGPAKVLLDRVKALVQEIVEGDFDQVDLYGAKLAELEAFIGDETHREVERNGSVALLEGKESELRVQQRTMQKLRVALDGIAMPAWLRDFVAQVWSQALVMAIQRDGGDSELARRYRNVGRDLVMSVQPKGSPMLRKRFLMQLPTLMKDMNEGMKLIGWPEAAQKDFFGKLLPAHAESLKAPPMSELDHNMLAKRLEAIFGAPLPQADEAIHAEPLAAQAAVEQQFTPAEARKVGLVAESAVDWSQTVPPEPEAEAEGGVDIDLGIDFGTPATHEATQPAPLASMPPMPVGIDVNLDLITADPAEPSRGPQLIDHVKLGFAYQMLLKDQWQKVRLTYVSPGRSFFVFTHGKKHAETVSMTARMLARMCEANRLRAVESAYLMERATARARRQLAAMKAA